MQINSKYSDELAQECLEWIKEITGEPINTSGDQDNFYEVLKNGVILCKLANCLRADSVKKIYEGGLAFKCMENITGEFSCSSFFTRHMLIPFLIPGFVEIAKQLGVPTQETFQTVDLWERQNLNAVIICLQSLGRKAHNLGKPGIGPKESEKNVRQFTDEQLKAGQNVISLQYGSNKGATQSGINFGNTRHM